MPVLALIGQIPLPWVAVCVGEPPNRKTKYDRANPSRFLRAGSANSTCQKVVQKTRILRVLCQHKCYRIRLVQSDAPALLWQARSRSIIFTFKGQQHIQRHFYVFVWLLGVCSVYPPPKVGVWCRQESSLFMKVYHFARTRRHIL